MEICGFRRFTLQVRPSSGASLETSNLKPQTSNPIAGLRIMLG